MPVIPKSFPSRPRSALRLRKSAPIALGALMVALLPSAPAAAGAPAVLFTDATADAGLTYQHGDVPPTDLAQFMGGGVAAGDFDGDGWVDLYVVAGTAGTNLLLRNLGDGTFEDVAAAAGVDLTGTAGSGPTFADLDGDGHLDLVIGDPRGGQPWLFRNRGDGTFEDRSAGSGLPVFPRVFSIAAGDVDLDGDLDLFFSQWNVDPADVLWRNDGGLTFSSATAEVLGAANDALLRTFTPNFVHLDDDGWPDLVVASDFDNSQVLLSNGDGTLRLATDPAVIVDQNGMGAAVGDFDGDGHMDWFVSSIYNPSDPFYQLGNRLYRNLGDGTFEDVTETAKVKHGHWGWGSCMADLDNDGRLDIFHVNGWRDPPYDTDPARLFLQGQDGSFAEEADACGVDDPGQGRGVVCFDYDRDGDLDLFVANNSGAPRLFRNDGGVALGGLVTVALRSGGDNPFGVGARLTLESDGQLQVREMRAGSHYASQNPAEVYFGLGSAEGAEILTVGWPNGSRSVATGLAAGERLVVDRSLLFSSSFEAGSLVGWSQIFP
ncbi:MAG: CRTAC1 family protein [Acidobacteriota bacterium]